MAKTRTAQQNANWWLARADEYAREAAKCITISGRDHWLKKAAAARTHAESYSLPASGEALTS